MVRRAHGAMRRSSLLAPFQVRSFRFQYPADLLTSWGTEMENLILGLVRAGYNRNCASRTGAPRVPKYCNEPNSVSNKTNSVAKWNREPL